MSRSTTPFEIPYTRQNLFVWLLTGLLLLLLASFGIEYLRRRFRRKRELKEEWRLAAAAARESGLSDSQWVLLRRMIDAHAPDMPLQTVRNRSVFQSCVDGEMAVLLESGDAAQFREIGAALRRIREILGFASVPLGQRLWSTRELQKEQSLWFATSAFDVPHWVEARVVAVDEAFFTVEFAGPAEESHPGGALGIAPGESVRCRFWRQTDARYLFSVELATVSKTPPMWTFYHAVELDRVQSREYYRVRFIQDAVVAVLGPPAPTEFEGVEARPVTAEFPGRILSLSAGGLAVVLGQALPKDALFRVALEFPGEQPLDAEARVVAAEPLSNNQVLIRAAFVGMDDDTRDLIARFILRRQQPVASPPPPAGPVRETE